MEGGLFFIVYIPANISAFLIIITGYTEAQMIALSEEMLHIWSDANKFYQDICKDDSSVVVGNKRRNENETAYQSHKRIVNSFIKQRLYELIKIHTTNIGLVQKVEMLYRELIAAEFILLTFGITVELLGRLENTYLQIPFALMQVALIS